MDGARAGDGSGGGGGDGVGTSGAVQADGRGWVVPKELWWERRANDDGATDDVPQDFVEALAAEVAKITKAV
jgi:hypothetical protein